MLRSDDDFFWQFFDKDHIQYSKGELPSGSNDRSRHFCRKDLHPPQLRSTPLHPID
jgi:hypothetical protein